MCGIAGYYGLSKNKKLLTAMNDIQAHRGPDGEGYFISDNIGFAHRRLAILDRAHGDQPMYSRDKNLAVVYNGEIYNYKTLRQELESLGSEFVTESDTEVVLHAYSIWGEDCFDKFNGMFAIALYDKKADRLLLARDHFGIKPLYYANSGTKKSPKLVFASEIKPILASNMIAKKPNERIIYRYLKYRIHDDDKETFFEGIYRLGAGELMIVDKSGMRVKSFTNLKNKLLELSDKNNTYNNYETDNYKKRLFEAIKLRLQSEVPVGTSLSGGLDSSTVAVVINQLMKDEASSKDVESVGDRQNTFSAVFPNAENNEEKYVDDVIASVSKVKSHKIEPTADEFMKDLEDFIRTQEEPIISTGPYAQYSVMKYAKDYVTVLLDGQGADEMMAGYSPYYFVYLNQLKKDGRWLKLAKESMLSTDILYRFLRIRIKNKLSSKTEVSMHNLLAKDFSKSYKNETFMVNNDNLKKRLIEDVFYNSLPSLLRYEDKNTMRFSIEGRVPFIDKDLIEYIFSLSDDAIIKNSWNKRILRDATKGLLPESIRMRRNKIGFTTPEGEWFMRLKNRFYAVFMSPEFASRPYFNQPEVVKAFEGFIAGTNNSNSLLFWRLLNLEYWFREFFDEKKTEITIKQKSNYEPNIDKKLAIKIDSVNYDRFTIATKSITKDDSINSTLVPYVNDFFDKIPEKLAAEHNILSRPWQLFVSEKVVAIMQGRSYFIWDIKPSWWAKKLSKYVTKTPYGIGLGSPFTMELAIKEVGLGRILYASILGGLGKLVGKRGLFYNLVGQNIRAIDGPTEYSLYPSNVSAKLAPKNPDKVARELARFINSELPTKYIKLFEGVVVIDSNDLGRNVLGKSVDEPNSKLEAIFADNPLGQGEEGTPIAIVFRG